MSDSPVVIVGGGPVGMTFALLLARHGVPSVILEAAEQRDLVGSKALCMQRDVLDVLERVGCGDRLLREGVTWTLGRTYYRDHELFQITFPELGENHYPPFVNIGQDRTEYWLENAVQENPLVDLRYGHVVTDVSTGDGVQALAETYSGEVEIAGSHVVGADGARSVVRKIMGVGFEGRSFDDRFLICDIRANLDFANERRFYFDPDWNPDRQVLIHPQRDSVWRIDWQVPSTFDLEAEESSGGLDSRIRKIVGDRDYEIVWKSVYRFHQRLASSFRVERMFLVGDAAHLMSVFGARGLNSGIQDAENLAWKLGFVRRGWAGEALLNSYDAERRAAAEENLRVTGATMDFLVPPTEELWSRRRTTLERAVGHPDAREMVDSGQLATPFDYADSPLTTPGDGFIQPGQLVPDGPVVVGDRPEVHRLRQLFGTGFVVLTTEAWAGRAPSSRAVDTYSLSDIDRKGTLRQTIRLGPGRALVIRPDGHVAANVLADADSVATALAKALAS
ncbi:MAG: pentachlorophenol monooxygenase [Acidimicrobiia bacterium]|nr:pentachlorophenol monooxygenase [Acidimicrobiia bacterium]